MSQLQLPEFPKNLLGLKRGTILKATSDAVEQLGLKKGDRIPIGYDGTYIRCDSLTWSVDQLIGEIQGGIWEIYGELDFSDSGLSREFAEKIEWLGGN